MQKHALILFAVFAALLLVACKPQQPERQPTKEDVGANTPEELADREEKTIEEEAENRKEYCTEKIRGFETGVSNAENDLKEHQLDLADAEAALAKIRPADTDYPKAKLAVDDAKDQIVRDQEDIQNNRQWLEDAKKECADVTG